MGNLVSAVCGRVSLLDALLAGTVTKGWQVLGLAIDQPSAVRKFLEKLPVSFPIALAGLEGTDSDAR